MSDLEFLDRRAFLRGLTLTSAGLLIPRTVFSKTTIVPAPMPSPLIIACRFDSDGPCEVTAEMLSEPWIGPKPEIGAHFFPDFKA